MMWREFISVFDMFKIGVGPSSSHTLGPWRAALSFVHRMEEQGLHPQHIQVDLYGSLAKTGRGHGTDLAVVMGLQGEDPATCPTHLIPATMQRLKQQHRLLIDGKQELILILHVILFFIIRKVFPFIQTEWLSKRNLLQARFFERFIIRLAVALL